MPPRKRKEEPVVEKDPFGPEPDQDIVPDGDEAQTEMPPPWLDDDETDVKNTDTEEKKAKVVTVGNAEGKITTTFKGGSGFEKPWVVVHAEDIQEQLSIINDPEFAELLTRVQKASEYFQGQAPAPSTAPAQNASQNGSQGRSQGKPAAATEGPLGPQYCTHGKKKFWSKFDDQKNELVQIYFCPAPKNAADKCKNQYVN